MGSVLRDSGKGSQHGSIPSVCLYSLEDVECHRPN